MLGIIMRLAERPFWLGGAIGLMFNIGLVPLVRASMIPSTDTSCTQTLSVPPEVQDWVNMQCAVNAAAFNDGLEPSAAYAMDTAVEAPGLYTGQTYDERPIELDVVWTVTADLENEAPELVAEGVTAQLVIALMSGVGGDVPIAGIVMQTGTLTLDEGYLLLVCDILSESEFATFQSAALLEQGMQVWNMSTSEIGSLETLDPEALTLWLPGFDPSTLIQGTPGGNPGGIGVGADCVNFAYANFQIDKDAAAAEAAICIALVMAIWAVGVAACTAGSLLLGPLSPLGFALCLAPFMAEQALGLAACAAIAAVNMNAAWERLRLALLQCGVMIL
ncbi:MAG: hypothetical protein DYG94_01455 [Leptolyngbya sp. PLA3]|nr:MAG: hypothetical protein EDM82_00425 [Cyanobacteria bacterium CYA]MCE7967397.1 hypothetical protein [Leptolyngbya sp. PL-A3]